MNVPNFDLSSAHRDADRSYAAAVDVLRERTGRSYLPDGHAAYRRRYNVNSSEVLRHHADLCAALNVTECEAKCNRAATTFCRGWFCADCGKVSAAEVSTS